MINDLRLRTETPYRHGECISIARSRRGGDYAFLRNAALTRTLKIYHLARGAFYIVPNRVVGQALNAQRSEGSDEL